MTKVLVTGGAGFIGSALIRHLLAKKDYHVLNIDKLTYASNLEALSSVAGLPTYMFRKLDIADRPAIEQAFKEFSPDFVINLAAETHVDRSIDAPADFLRTNISGTFTLLEASLDFWRALPAASQNRFRFHQVSTDEVYGDLGSTENQFNELSAYAPSSPYSATKAASDHLVGAWHRTYGLPTLITHCSNNYGPYQFPEKLIPLMILNALNGKQLPVYGQGQQIRDWLHVDDHADALELVMRNGRAGETYDVGGGVQIRNIEVVQTICGLLEEAAANRPEGVNKYSDLIHFVTDRPGHDLRYSVDFRKINTELGWSPRYVFEDGIRSTIDWYLNNLDWCNRTRHSVYGGERLGLARQHSE